MYSKLFYLWLNKEVMAKLFFIEVDRVSKQSDGSFKILKEQIPGHLVRRVRKWNKSVKDLMIVGEDQEMASVTLVNESTQTEYNMRIAEDQYLFTQRLKKESNG